MTEQGDLTLAFTVDRSPAEVYATINDVRNWWEGRIDGPTDVVGAEFTYRNDPHHVSRQRITQLVPGERVAWHVVDAELFFTQNRSEWVGTDVVFELAAVPGGTQVRFTHVGLRPELECYESCSGGWAHYVAGELRRTIEQRAA